MIDVFEEALDFQRGRKVISDGKKYMSREFDAMRPRAFWAAGLQKHATAVAMNRVIEQTLAENLTDSEAMDRLADVLEANGDALLPANRIRVIFHNALTTARASGTWKQSMAFVEDRPYFIYAGPAEGPSHHISDICRPMRGRIVHHTSPVLKTFWPPNHHLEASEWESLAADQVDESNVYDGTGDDEKYPVIDGRQVRPADGFEFDPSDAMSADERIFVSSAKDLTEQQVAKTSADYGLDAIAESDAIPRAPKLGQAVSSTKASIERAWTRFQADVGIERSTSGAWVLDYGKDAVRINRDSFEMILTDEDGIFDGDRARLFPLVRPTIEQPYETWFVPYTDEDGETVHVKRYIGAYRNGRKTITVVIDRTDNGWLWRMVTPDDVEALREGLLVNTKAGKQ